MNIDHLSVFLRIVDQGSLAGAGRVMSLSSTTVSERLASLESYYGARLFNRTTRALHLTDAGRALLDGAPRLIAEADELRAQIRSGAESLTGPLRISAPIDLGRRRIAGLLDAFLLAHPGVTAELMLRDGYLDILAESVDIAVRFGSLPDSSLGVRRLGDNRRVVCASPEYLEAHGAPTTPDDLREHNCLCMRFGTHLDNEWRFQDCGRHFTVRVVGDRVADDGSLVGRWCLEGRGIALKSEWDVPDALASGELVELLSDYAPQPNALQLVFPPGRTHPRRVEAFAAVLVAALRSP